MKTLFIADTPYQIFNSLNLQFYRVNRSINDSHADIFIVNQFADAEFIAEKLRATKLFENVYCLKMLERHEDKAVIIQWSYMLIRLVFPYIVLREQMYKISPKCFKNKYEFIYASYFNPIVASMLKINSYAKLVHMEDGTGSYFSDIFSKSTGWKYKIVSKLTNTGTNLAKPIKYYLNNPDFFIGIKRCKIEGLPNITESFIKIANTIFDSMPDDNMKKIIWLSDPIQDKEYGENTKEIVRELVADFKPYEEMISVRLHPRECRPDIYSGLYIDKSRGNWELLVPQIDIENMALIGLFSTAQFSPKILYDKEPYLIFLNNIYVTRNTIERKKMIGRLIHSYSNPDRIMLPSTKSELISCIESLKKSLKVKKYERKSN